MNNDSDELMNELLNDYISEATEHIQNIQDGLIQLENCADTGLRMQLTESIFRETHSLKGSSRVLNQSETEKICMCLESHFSILKKHAVNISTDYFNVYNNATALLGELLRGLIQKDLKPSHAKIQQIIQTLEFSLNSLQKLSLEKPASQVQSNGENENVSVEKTNSVEQWTQKETQNSDIETIRIEISKLNNILLKTEDFISSKNTLEYIQKEMSKIQTQLLDFRKNERIQTDIFGEKEKFNKIDEHFRLIHSQLKTFQNILVRQIDDLQTDIKSTLLLPLRTLFISAPKLVRDLSIASAKKVKFSISGDTIEMDRRIIEDLKDPVMHILRNCIDHGIETPQQRKLKEKNEQGIIHVEIKQLENKKIQLDISDDGAGINTQKIIQKALKNKIITTEQVEKSDPSDFNSLIFKSGISTSDIITEISGRGLGMAIVEEKLLKNNGTIELITAPDKGTTFRFTLPQTLSVYRGILIKVAAAYFSFPISSVVKAIRLKVNEIKTIEGRRCLFLKEKAISVFELTSLLGIKKTNKTVSSAEPEHALLIENNGLKAVIIVDKIIGQFESVQKEMGSQLKHVENIAGLTLLGNGNLVPIINTSELLQNARNTTISIVKNQTESEENETKNRILVAEDSITIRTMLRSYLENAGYIVKTAIDGAQAFEFLQQNEYDLVVSDVEMPRMNGFELTAKIRETMAYAHLPVILVTALETADDKQRGLEAGANAYIVKRSFEQSNLVETIKRLL